MRSLFNASRLVDATRAPPLFLSPLAAVRLRVWVDRTFPVQRLFERCNLTLQLFVDLPDGDREDTLAAGQKIHDLVRRDTRVNRLSVGDERDVFDRKVQLVTEIVDRSADLRETDSGIEQFLDHTQLHDIV